MTTLFKTEICLVFLVPNYLVKYFTDLFPDGHKRLVSNSKLKPDLPFIE